MEVQTGLVFDHAGFRGNSSRPFPAPVQRVNPVFGHSNSTLREIKKIQGNGPAVENARKSLKVPK